MHGWRAFVAYKVGKRRWRWYWVDAQTLDGAVLHLTYLLDGWVGKPNTQVVGTITTLTYLEAL